jgi:hypothetical protein
MDNTSNDQRINKIDETSDTITGRGGLALFSRYLETIGIFTILVNHFGHLRKSSKGLAIWKIFKQIFCFFLDGTSRHLTYFDHVKKDAGYAAAIETMPADMASSHVIKRFFGGFFWWFGSSFRRILRNNLFIWRLKIEQPDEIRLFIDTMVMDNDDADKRQGVQATYKKVKGFQPLQIIWNGKIIDAIFRGGKKNGNNGNTVVNAVDGLVKLIRREYRKDVTIIIECDAGFFDQKNFIEFDNMNIGFIATGKMYEGAKTFASSTGKEFWNKYDNGKQIWNFTEFGFRCENWNFFLRAIYMNRLNDDEQLLLNFERPDNVILSNIGVNEKVLENCTQERKEYWLKPETIIASHHKKGADELTHRSFKDFGFEELPFKNFNQNCAFYYCMVIAFFLYETFKEDVLVGVIPVTACPTTVRRKIIDIAAKIVKSGHQIILKVSEAVIKTFKFNLLWERCKGSPPIIA